MLDIGGHTSASSQCAGGFRTNRTTHDGLGESRCEVVTRSQCDCQFLEAFFAPLFAERCGGFAEEFLHRFLVALDKRCISETRRACSYSERLPSVGVGQFLGLRDRGTLRDFLVELRARLRTHGFRSIHQDVGSDARPFAYQLEYRTAGDNREHFLEAFFCYLCQYQRVVHHGFERSGHLTGISLGPLNVVPEILGGLGDTRYFETLASAFE